VECRGNETIPCDFIRRKLRLPANSEVDGDAVQSAQLRLSALPNFESVRVYLEKGSEKGKALLIVEVIEADSLITELALGLRYSVVEPQDTPFISETGDILNEAIAGRLSNQNLFGRQKIAEFAIGGMHAGRLAANSDFGNGNWLRESEWDHRSYTAAAIYIDPNLFGSEHWFASVSAGYESDRASAKRQLQYTYTDPNSNLVSTTYFDQYESINEQAFGSLSVGYRLWDYSYLYGRFIYRTTQFKGSDSSLTVSSDSAVNFSDSHQYEGQDSATTWVAGYGWDSEDDAYFPTRGLRVSASVNDCSRCDEVGWRLAYKQTWMMGKSSVWTLNVGGEPDAPGDRLRPIQNMGQGGFNDAPVLQDSVYYGGLAVTYSHLLSPSDTLGGVRRGRWYVKLGTGPVDISKDGLQNGGTGEYLDQAHLTFGLRFESKVLGVVDLFATGSYFWPQRP
jgi:hypothetical protein